MVRGSRLTASGTPGSTARLRQPLTANRQPSARLARRAPAGIDGADHGARLVGARRLAGEIERTAQGAPQDSVSVAGADGGIRIRAAAERVGLPVVGVGSEAASTMEKVSTTPWMNSAPSSMGSA